jgi:hypothetical protein
MVAPRSRKAEMPEETPSGMEETPAPQNEETPGIESGPDNGIPADSPEIDFEQRYNDLRSEFDRRNQQYSEAEQLQAALSGAAGPEAQAQILANFGIELEDDEDFDAFDELDEYDPDARIDRLEAMLEEQQMAAEEEMMAEAEVDYLTDGIEALESQEGREFSDQEIAILASVARANPDANGAPNLEVAHAHLTELLQDRQSAWVQSKKAKRPGSGVAAERAADLDNDEARVQFMADRIAAADDE